LLLLFALRLPSLVQPAGGDQGLYAYEGQRILAGDVMYRDVWDQKPPGIGVIYAALLAAWPHESVVPLADLVAAGLVAALLVVLGRRLFSEIVGLSAGALFLLFGDPNLQRLSGIYVRGQCEPFVSLAVAAALVLATTPARRRWHLVVTGVALAAAVWIKYNAVTYALPVALAIAWRQDSGGDRRFLVRDLAWVAVGGIALSAIPLLYFAISGALHDLWLATVTYNLQYSNETYEAGRHPILYVLTLPFVRARLDMLWYLGGLGALLLVPSIFISSWGPTPTSTARLALLARRAAGASSRASRVSVVVSLAWIVAAILSIAINGQRDLPNYFVQANPALALAAAGGLAAGFAGARWLRFAIVAVIVAGLWRVGDETPVLGMRLGGLPGVVSNIQYDLSYVRGRLDRGTYLGRFKGVKHDALEVDNLARYLRDSTQPSDRVLVFGFSGGSVCWKSARTSATRFFWSRPVLIEFAADEPGYGSAGLLEDLTRNPPVVVALQKEQWESAKFFLNSGPLRGWLEARYARDRETSMFDVWRRKPGAR
jgi:hypothetical protein